MIYFFQNILENNGFELFKWVVSFVFGGGTIALVKYLLDKFL